jgi:hypothetical protein
VTLFTVDFYGLTIFSCKTAQLCVTRRESEMTELPSVGNAVQSSEMMRNSLGLNYETAALPAELRRHEWWKHCIHRRRIQALYLCPLRYAERSSASSPRKALRKVFATRAPRVSQRSGYSGSTKVSPISRSAMRLGV